MNFFSQDLVNDIVSFVFTTTTSNDTSAIIKNMGHLLDTVGCTDKYSKERIQIMTCCIQKMQHTDVYHLLLEEDEHGIFQKIYAAKYRWSILRTYFIKMRPVALVLLEEWQRRCCAPGKAGFQNDCNHFCRFSHQLS